MTIVILDTCGLQTDYVFRNAKARKLLSHSKLGSFDLEIPEAAYKEIEKHARAKAARAAKKVHDGVGALQFLGLDVKSASLLGEGDTSSDTIWAQVVEKLEDANVTVLPHPEVTHEELLKRSIPERKPFAPSNKGYHDALIWETVLTRAVDDDVVLITTNTKDFSYGGEDPHPKLHADLVEDLRKAGLPDDRVRLAGGIQPALELGVAKVMEVALVVENAIKRDPEVESLVRDSVGEVIDATLIGSSDDVVVTRAHVDQDEPIMVGLMLGDVRVVEAFEEEEADKFTIVFEAFFEADFELFVNDFEMEEIRLTDPSIDLELTGETYGIARATNLEGSSFVYATYDRSKQEFSDWERAGITVAPYDAESGARGN